MRRNKDLYGKETVPEGIRKCFLIREPHLSELGGTDPSSDM